MRISFDAFHFDERLTSTQEKKRLDQVFAEAVILLKECKLDSPHVKFRIKKRYPSKLGQPSVTYIEFKSIPFMVWWRYWTQHKADQWCYIADDEWKTLYL